VGPSGADSCRRPNDADDSPKVHAILEDTGRGSYATRRVWCAFVVYRRAPTFQAIK